MSISENLAQRLRASEARADAILRASLDAIVMMDHEGRFLDFSPAAETMFGYRRGNVLGKPIADFIIPERLREAHRIGMARYVATGTGEVVNHRVELPAVRANGEEFPAEIAIVPIEGEADLVFVGFIRDISERKAAEERQAFLLAEISHRGKNLLAVMQAIVHRTLKDHTADEAREIISRRISALARSQAALALSPSGAPLRDIITEELEGFSNRVLAQGPDLHVRAEAAQTLALIVHELATNATKHGALSNADGQVSLVWTVSQDPAPVFVFEWRESGGPEVMPPTRSGFGRTVLERIATSVFKSAPMISFPSDGVIYRLEALLTLVVEGDEA